MSAVEAVLTVVPVTVGLVLGYMLGWLRGYYVRKGAKRRAWVDPESLK